MLNAQLLTDIIAGNGKNEYLKELPHWICRYDNAHQDDQYLRVELLMSIAIRAGYWLTYRPPTVAGKNVAKRKALLALLDEVGSEIEDMKLRSAIGNFRTINAENRNYWLEMLDPKHRPGQSLSAAWDKWQASKASKTFFDWLDAEPGALGGPAFRGVVGYGDGEAFDAEKYRVFFGKRNLLRDLQSVKVDTRLRTSGAEAMGQGWAIFAASVDALYVGDGNPGTVHHTSYVGGRPVIAAGEICVEDGRIRALTAQSGHYRTKQENLRNFLRTYPHVEAIVQPVPRTQVWYSRSEFMNPDSTHHLTPTQIARVVPAYAQSANFQDCLPGQVPPTSSGTRNSQNNREQNASYLS